MNFPFPLIEDKYAPEGTLLLLALRSKLVSMGTGEPPILKEEIDWDETAKASAVIYNIGEK